MNQPTSEKTQPARTTWLLCGHKAGDNNQILALAEALGWPYLRKQMRYRHWELVTNRLLGITLAGIDRPRSDPLAPPWPDLVLTAGRRNEPVARWIKKRSGGKTRIVHVGRPWASPGNFDLVIVTPQYFVPALPNVETIDLPLHRVNRTLLAEAGRQWATRFENLARPYQAVLLGGNSGATRFTEDKARYLARWLNTRVTRGSVLVTDSSRTPAASYDAFLETLHVPVYTHRWRNDTENPYLGYLALADEIVVTSESISMLAEAAATAKPLYIFSLDERDHPVSTFSQKLTRGIDRLRWQPLSHRIGQRLAPCRLRRDISPILANLVNSGRARRIGEKRSTDTLLSQDNTLMPDLKKATARVRGLFDQGNTD